jgi:putative acetyltransferase
MFAVRSELPADIPAIHRVLAESFPSPLEAQLVEALRSANRLTLSLVGITEDQVVGHIALSPIDVDNALGLAPVAVLPRWQGQGLGGELIRSALEWCRAKQVGFVVVLGSPEYYGRFGFRSASHWGLLDEYGGGDAFQLIELVENAVPRGRGLVRYAPEFSIFAP